MNRVRLWWFWLRVRHWFLTPVIRFNRWRAPYTDQGTEVRRYKGMGGLVWTIDPKSARFCAKRDRRREPTCSTRYFPPDDGGEESAKEAWALVKQRYVGTAAQRVESRRKNPPPDLI